MAKEHLTRRRKSFILNPTNGEPPAGRGGLTILTRRSAGSPDTIRKNAAEWNPVMRCPLATATPRWVWNRMNTWISALLLLPGLLLLPAPLRAQAIHVA